MIGESSPTLIEVPDPVFYDYIEFYDGDRFVKYTDCWEISVLRFLHLLFGEKGAINFEKLKAFMDENNPHCQKLIHYFTENKTYEIKE